MMFGTMLAVVYAVPRQVVPTVCANTTCRPNPTSRASTVMTPIITAARPIPCRPSLCGRGRARSGVLTAVSGCRGKVPVLPPRSREVPGSRFTGTYRARARSYGLSTSENSYDGPVPPVTAGTPAAYPPGQPLRPRQGDRLRGGCQADGRPGRGRGRGRERHGAAAEHVEPAQRGRGLDDLGEADLLAGHGQRDDPGEQAEPCALGQRLRRRRAEHRAERVGARVAEHGPLAEVGRQ